MLIDGQTLLAGCASGALRKLDWSAIGGRDRLLPQAGTECGQGAVLRGMVLAWSRDKFSGAPNWADFWDVAKVPGKRGLWRGARGNLEFALIADGVAPSDVYATLRDKPGWSARSASSTSSSPTSCGGPRKTRRRASSRRVTC